MLSAYELEKIVLLDPNPSRRSEDETGQRTTTMTRTAAIETGLKATSSVGGLTLMVKIVPFPLNNIFRLIAKSPTDNPGPDHHCS